MPEGSCALGGVGCHLMAVMMGRNTLTISHMGGEGAAWLGVAGHSGTQHVFANMGDGTYFHSGLLAIRAAVAAKVNITYKLLFNDAVAMTGGQPVDGTLTVPQLTRQLAAEDVARIIVMSDEPEKYKSVTDFAPGVEIRHRERLDETQRELRETRGVSALVYDQTCAAEKRRRRKRGSFKDPAQRVFINTAVCEGCGDCAVKSNCLAVVPVETEFGRKRATDQFACNKDFSCLDGFCPSMVTVHGGSVRRGKALAASEQDFAALPRPPLPDLVSPYGILIAGVGGTGVVTIGALLGMAAHLDGKGVTVLDMTGLAQKGGAVMSHVRLAERQEQLHSARIATGEAMLILGCDLVVTVTDDVLSKAAPSSTRAIVNTGHAITGEFLRNPDREFPAGAMEQAVVDTLGRAATDFIDATRLATRLMGHSIATNIFLLGYAFQRGLVPLSLEAILRAIELNGAAVEDNLSRLPLGPPHRPRPGRRRGPARRQRRRGRHISACPTTWTPSSPAAASISRPTRTRPMRSATRRWSSACAPPKPAPVPARHSPKPSPAATTSCWPTRTNTRWRGSTPRRNSPPNSPPPSRATTAWNSTSPCPGAAARRRARNRKSSASAPGC